MLLTEPIWKRLLTLNQNDHSPVDVGLAGTKDLRLRTDTSRDRAGSETSAESKISSYIR